MLSGNTPKKKRLIGFYDVNDTIFVGDSAKGVDKETSIAKLIAENHIAIWDKTITQQAMTYRDFVEKHLVPGDRRDPVIQSIHNAHYKNLLYFLSETNHPLAPSIKMQFEKISCELQKGNIPTSFIRLLEYLDTHNYEYTFVARTFGHDIHELEKELAERTSITNLEHAVFKDGALITSNNKTLSTPEALLKHIRPGVHSAWQDNFAHWRTHNEDYQGGKPFPFHFDDEETIVIMFDDNTHKKIIHAQPTCSDQFDQASLQQMLIAKGRLVEVNTFEVCVDEDYFIKRIQQAYQTQLKFADYLPLSENGKLELDEAIFCWAVFALNPHANMGVARQCFKEVAQAYQDDARVFHRGLGHPRALLPNVSQLAYKILLSKNNLQHDLINDIKNLNGIFNKHIVHEKDKKREAQEILAGFYHDVVHRNGKKPASLSAYLHKNQGYQIKSDRIPLTAKLIAANDTQKVEALSCIVAEDALRKLRIDETSMLTIINAIYSTIPFTAINLPERQVERVKRMNYEHDLELSTAEIKQIVQSALDLTNRDHGSYADDTLDEFNQKSWAMMLERNPNLVNPTHTLKEEAETIAGFYKLHQSLHQAMSYGKIDFYHALEHNEKIQIANERAKEMLAQDCILQSVQLASLAIRMAIQAANEDPDAYLKLYENISNVRYADLPANVAAVLKNHNQSCCVNGVHFIRGTDNADFALRFTALFGIEKMRAIADKYQIFSNRDLETLFADIPKPVLETEVPRNSVNISEWQKFATFAPPQTKPHAVAGVALDVLPTKRTL